MNGNHHFESDPETDSDDAEYYFGDEAGPNKPQPAPTASNSKLGFGLLLAFSRVSKFFLQSRCLPKLDHNFDEKVLKIRRNGYQLEAGVRTRFQIKFEDHGVALIFARLKIPLTTKTVRCSTPI